MRRLDVLVLVQKRFKIRGRDPHHAPKAVRHELAGPDPAMDRSRADVERLRNVIDGEKLRCSLHQPPPARLTAAVEPKVCADVQASISETR